MRIERLVERYVDMKEPAMLFINRQGDIDSVSLRPGQHDSDDDGRDIVMELLEHAGCSRPYFQICTVIDGVIQDQEGDVITIDDLQAAVRSAEQERIRFYSEREEIYGESAWPHQYAY